MVSVVYYKFVIFFRVLLAILLMLHAVADLVGQACFVRKSLMAVLHVTAILVG